jgi:hypothetical protein
VLPGGGRTNDVTPFGELIATSARGMFMGNRGRLHDDDGQTVRFANGRRWITCLLDFKDRHRQVMAPGRYTELFFLDEATALAAGHRPCAECRRDDYRRFGGAVRAALGAPEALLATELDALLDAERGRGEKWRAQSAVPADLPSGTFVEIEGRPFVVVASRVAPWEPAGYGRPVAAPARRCPVITPPTTVQALANGYRAVLHPSLD